METTNGTTYTIGGTRVTIVGKTEEGWLIVQTPAGMDFTWPVDFLEKIVDKK